MKIICISGKAGNGKDTFADFLRSFLDDTRHKILTTHYADLVKYVCTKFFGWDGQKDQKGRSLLQYVGTDKVRTFSPDFWVNFICCMLTIFHDEWEYVLIPDCRFPNEVDVLKSYGFDVMVVRVERMDYETSLTKSQSLHPSEIAMDTYNFDYVAAASDLEDLADHAATVAQKLLKGDAE